MIFLNDKEYVFKLFNRSIFRSKVLKIGFCQFWFPLLQIICIVFLPQERKEKIVSSSISSLNQQEKKTYFNFGSIKNGSFSFFLKWTTKLEPTMLKALWKNILYTILYYTILYFILYLICRGSFAEKWWDPFKIDFM